MRFLKMVLFAACALVLLPPARVYGQVDPNYTTPIPPFQIADNLYYVGSRDLASYLVVTPQGDILINANMESSPPLIKTSVEQLGFRFSDIKILLTSHAHWDHIAGSAEVKRMTGARFEVMDADVPVIESGGRKDFAYPDHHYPPAKVDRILHDGDEVRLGGAVLVAHKTPGHTRGCTTWTMRVTQHGKPLNVVIVGSWNVNPEFRLVARNGKPASYPGIAADYKHSFEVFEHLPCDIFLGAHGGYFDMLAKLQRMPAEGEAVWIDPEGYKAAVAERKAAFEAELSKEMRE